MGPWSKNKCCDGMVMFQNGVAVPMNRCRQVFLETVRVTVFLDECSVLLQRLHNGRNMNRYRHGGPQADGNANQRCAGAPPNALSSVLCSSCHRPADGTVRVWKSA